MSGNVMEDDDKYMKRMSGVVRLFAAVVQCPTVVWGQVRGEGRGEEGRGEEGRGGEGRGGQGRGRRGYFLYCVVSSTVVW